MIKYFKKSIFTAPILVLCTYLFTFLSTKVIRKAAFQTKEELFLSYIVLEFLIFVLPAIIYVKWKPRGYTSEMHLLSFGFTQIPLVILMLFVMAFGGILLSILMAKLGVVPDTSISDSAASLVGGEYVTDVKDILYVSITLAFVPAFSEELVFRTVLLKEYEGYGMMPSILLSSVLFAILHFQPVYFPFYFLFGMALGFTAYVTRSMLSCVALHALYNIYALFLQPLVANFLSEGGGGVTAFYLVTVLFLLFLMLALGEAERLFHLYSSSNIRSPKLISKNGSMLPISLEALLSPTYLLCIAVFLFTILRAYF